MDRIAYEGMNSTDWAGIDEWGRVDLIGGFTEISIICNETLVRSTIFDTDIW